MAEQIRAAVPADCALPVEVHCQDEARFGLKTTQRRRITARGVKPAGTCQHGYANTWLFGTVAPASGDCFTLIWPRLNTTNMQVFIDLSEDRDRWIFVGVVRGKQGKPRLVRLFKAELMPIKRHTKIQGAANPYDPEWEMYFERRLDVKMASDLKGRRKLLRLWKAQAGLCPVCKQKITRITTRPSRSTTPGGANCASSSPTSRLTSCLQKSSGPLTGAGRA